jgi:hypothetical protein
MNPCPRRAGPDLHVAALGAWFTVAMLASTAIAAPVEVASGTQEAACPDQAAVREALVAQVGDGAPTRGWRLTYRRTEEAAAGGRGALRLELADDTGQTRLRRQLRVGGDCRAQAEAVALIVYRFFAQLEAAGSVAVPPSPPPSVPAPPPPTEAAGLPPSPSPLPPSPPPAVLGASVPARSPPRLRLSLEAGAGLWTRRPGAGTGVFGLRVAWSNVEAALSLLAPRAPGDQRSVSGGEVEGSALGMALSVGLAWEGARLRLHGGPMSILCREWARSRKIAIPAENTGTTVALGLAAGASWRLWGGLRLGVEAGLGHAVLGNRFVVGGWGPVLAPPPWQGVAMARLGYTFSR